MQPHQRNQVGILGAHVAALALNIFVALFLMARIFSETDYSLLVIGYFNLVQMGALIVGFAATSYFVKRFSRVWSIRFSAVLKVTAILMIIFMQDYIVEYYLLFVAIFGLADGIYWGAILTLTSQSLSGKRMGAFIAWEQVIRALATIAFPFTLGILIDFVDFHVAAIISGVLGLVLVGFTFVLTEEKTRDNRPLSMIAYLRTMKQTGKSRAVWSHFALQTFHDTYRRVTVLVTVLIILAFGDNLSLGMFGSIFAAANIVIIILWKWSSKKSQRVGKGMYWVSAVAPLLFGIPLMFIVSPATIILLQVGYFAFGCIIRAEADELRFNLTSYMGDKSWHTESLLLTEYGFFIPRVIMPLVIILAYFVDAFIIVQGLVLAMMALVLVVGVMIHGWRRKYIQVQAKGSVE